MSRYSPQIASLRKQLEAAPWLKWGMAAIAVLGVAFAWQLLHDARVQAQADATEEVVRLRRIQALEGQDVWMKRASDASELHRAVLAQIPVATTPGVAQATLQGRLRDLAAAASDIEGLRINVADAVVLEQPAGLLRVNATLAAGMPPRQALEMIRRIEEGAELVVIESADIRVDTTQTASISLTAYYRTIAEPAQ